MKRLVLTVGLLAMIAGCSDENEVSSDALKEEDRAVVEKLAGIDPTEGLKIAAWCADCHGLDGISTDVATPHVADQQPYYLFTRLKAYRDGGRDDASMTSVVRSLGENAMLKVAAYYGSLEPPVPMGAEEGSSVELAPGPVEAGRVLAEECSGCHGEDGNSDVAGMPGLAGHHPADLMASMHAYKVGSRDHPIMQVALEGFSAEDINNIALFYAVQQPRRTELPGRGDAVAGKRVAAACAACHGEDGNSLDPNTPSLAGEGALYLVEATKAYRDGARTYFMMRHPVESLSDQDIENLATFYAEQEPVAQAFRRPLTVADWAARCNRCHGDDGQSTDPRFPSLSAQHKTYMEVVLKAYQTDGRKNSMMRAMSTPLSDAEIEGMAAYYANKSRNPGTAAEK